MNLVDAIKSNLAKRRRVKSEHAVEQAVIEQKTAGADALLASYEAAHGTDTGATREDIIKAAEALGLPINDLTAFTRAAATMAEGIGPDIDGDHPDYGNGRDVYIPDIGRGLAQSVQMLPFLHGDFDGARMRLGARFYTRTKRGPGRGRKRQRIVYPPLHIIDSFSDLQL